jgi:hypothetical protein
MRKLGLRTATAPIRYSPTLDPRTGWAGPERAPLGYRRGQQLHRAGLLATLPMLQGDGACAFLEEQGACH